MAREELPALCPVDQSPDVKRLASRRDENAAWKTEVHYACGCVYEDPGLAGPEQWKITVKCPNAHDTALQLRADAADLGG